MNKVIESCVKDLHSDLFDILYFKVNNLTIMNVWIFNFLLSLIIEPCRRISPKRTFLVSSGKKFLE